MIRCLAGLLLLVSIGCSNGLDNAPAAPAVAPLSVAGDWTWEIQNQICPDLAGFLNGLDGTEVFSVTQNGNRIQATFTDDAGNNVVLDANLDGDRVDGTFTVTEPASVVTQNSGFICNGKLYALEQRTPGRVVISDLEAGTFIKLLSLSGGSGYDLTTSPDGRYVFVHDATGLHVLSTATDEIVHTFPNGGAAAASADTIYVAEGATVVAYDADTFVATGATLGLSSSNVFQLLVDAARQRLYALSSPTVEIFDLGTGGLIRSASTLGNPAKMALDADGVELIVVHLGAFNTGQTRIFDVSDPAASVDSSDVPVSATDVAIAGSTALFAVADGLLLWDRTTRAAITTVAMPEPNAVAVCADENVAFAMGETGTRTVDLGTQTVVGNPNKVGTSGVNASLAVAAASGGSPTPPPAAAPRRTVITFAGTVAFNAAEGTLAGNFTVTSDNESHACVGSQFGFEVQISR